jgi:hypothetical protein
MYTRPGHARYHGLPICQMVGWAKLSSHGTPIRVNTSQPQPSTRAPERIRQGPFNSQIINGTNQIQ